MNFKILQDFSLTAQNTIVLFLHNDFNPKNIAPQYAFIGQHCDLSHFEGKNEEILFIPLKNSPNIILCGIGNKNVLTEEVLRNAAAKVIQTARKYIIEEIHIELPESKLLSEEQVLTAIAEGLSLSYYSFSKYKKISTRNEKKALIKNVCFKKPTSKNAARILKNTLITSNNVHRCRDLVNETSDYANPVAIAQLAKQLSKIKNISVKVLQKKQLEKLQLGLLLAVSRGSTTEPQLVIISYKGNPASKKSIALVGKGITFDSGGLNLKPSGHIEEMRSDMAGAATMLYTIKTAAELGLKKNIHVALPLCDNLIGSNSYRPGDIFTAYNGKTVEIGNTDAEGRLILGDTLAYVEKNLKPSYIIDAATLTGACLVSFGEIYAALLTEHTGLKDQLLKAATATGEKLWALPLDPVYDRDIKSDIADIKNIGNKREAGTIIGAIFLKQFIEKTPWAHIDIAGTSWYSKQRGYMPKNATGYGIRLLLETIHTLDV